MIGSIIGDVAGSFYEFCNTKSKDFEFFSDRSRFTDDSVLTVATADWLLHGGRYFMLSSSGENNYFEDTRYNVELTYVGK